MSYKSPIEVYLTQMRFEQEQTIEGAIYKAVQGLDISVSKDELIKALRYDREQYDHGYHDGYYADKWVNCSDRLPKDGEPVLVWFEYFRYGSYNRVFQTVGIGYPYRGEWLFINDQSGWQDLKVYAWQPLPTRPTKFAIIRRSENDDSQ